MNIDDPIYRILLYKESQSILEFRFLINVFSSSLNPVDGPFNHEIFLMTLFTVQANNI